MISSSPIATVKQKLLQGELILLVDDSFEAFSAYLVCAAESISAERVSFMVNEARGLVCATLNEDRVKELGLSPMIGTPSKSSPDFTVSVEARKGVTTGISAADRARTLRTLVRTKSPRLDLVTPGHVFPIQVKKGGVLVRNAPAEAASDLLALSGVTAVAALCQCLDGHGDIASPTDIERLSEAKSLPIIKISDIVRIRLANEMIIEKIAEAKLPTPFAGDFRAFCFRSRTDGSEHLALVKGDLNKRDERGEEVPILARVQAEQRVSDLLGTNDVGGRKRIDDALTKITEAGRGIFVYVRRPQRSLAYICKNSGAEDSNSTIVSSLKEYGVGAQILRFLGAKKIRLLSSAAKDTAGIGAFQIEIVERIEF